MKFYDKYHNDNKVSVKELIMNSPENSPQIWLNV